MPHKQFDKAQKKASKERKTRRAERVTKQRSTGHSETHSGGNPSAKSIYGDEY
tara:strand:+ start:47 stop:205 length:159 start_codon:yes stop_codon:yes gene_type:complete